jgi:hypothetical protein
MFIASEFSMHKITILVKTLCNPAFLLGFMKFKHFEIFIK